MQAFFDHIRKSVFGGSLRQSQVDGINAILDATVGMSISHRAYILATAAYETAWTVQPIREYGQGKGRTYGKPGKHNGQIAYGRGFVQLTWDRNYEKADKELGLDGALVADYDLALEPGIAADILVRGMADGWFTEKKLSDYLPGDYVNARRIVNGTDKAHEIAGHARRIEDALRLADKPQDASSVVVASVPAAVDPAPLEPALPEPSGPAETKEPKSPVSSVGVWGGVIAALAGAAALYGYTVTDVDAAELSELVTGLVATVGGIVAVVGRIRATRQIKL